MTYWRISFGRSSAIILFLFATTIFCLNPGFTAAQALESSPASTDHRDVPPSSMPQGGELQSTRQDLTRDSLPIAASNFAFAAAGGFVGMGILPDGYNDITHAEQRMASEFLQIAIGNIATEFEPQWGLWAKKLRLPKILPAWWVPQHPHQP
jgi:hypothetical protein